MASGSRTASPSSPTAAPTATSKVLDAEADRPSVLARFGSNLSESDEAVLRDLLRQNGG
ncbi:hypothetical protein [Amycolatopsis sp. GA6-003]|uniref:hypothetical protein n=1 Tax=Amycolatopsis sp. GA6-003 TaxID=2652444 RepID=UPI00391702EA